MNKQWLAVLAAVSFSVSAMAAEKVIDSTYTEYTDQSAYMGPVTLNFSQVFSEDPTVLTNKQCRAIFTRFTLDKAGSFQSKTVKFGPSKTIALKLSETNRMRVWQSKITSSVIGAQSLPFYGATLVTTSGDSEKHTGLGNFIAGPGHGVVKAVRMPAAK